MTLRALALALLLSIYPGVFASQGELAAGRIGNVLIDIPSGLNGPHRSFPNRQTELDVYVSATGLPPTLLQLTWVNIPEARVDLSEDEWYEAASNFLDGFLTIFSKNVSNWTRSAGEPVQLGGYKAVRAKWSGKFHELPNSGTMYLVVLGRNSYCFHAFGRNDVPNATLSSAIEAIERLHVQK
jgi:hypothetical protein